MRAIGLQSEGSCIHYVVLNDAGEVYARKTIRANYGEIRREFRAFEPTCIALEFTPALRWVVDLLTGLDHAVQIAPVAADAETHARRISTIWKRGVAAMRAAARDTAIEV